MFSPQIVDSDAFLDMSSAAQNLYFHLGMRADDDGFVSNPKKIMRMVGGNDDDLKILLVKRFILTFENGIMVIKHWKINNLIRKDWYRPTIYQEQLKQLSTKENSSYTEKNKELVNENSPTRSRRLVEVRLGKEDSTSKSNENLSYSTTEWNKVLKDWKRSGGKVIDNQKLVRKKNNNLFLVDINNKWTPFISKFEKQNEPKSN